MRLDKYLVAVGLGSRTEVKNLLKKKRITVNGQVESSAKTQIDELSDQISCDGQLLTYEKFVYYLLNKPAGVISATEDKQHKTVLDLLKPEDRKKDIFPVGRLDIDTTGLLLLTNNGNLAHAMLSPKKHVSKRYQTLVEGVMTAEDVARFKQGIALKDFTCQPAELVIDRIDPEKAQSLVQITISEGKFHQIKRMVAACGKQVIQLERLSMGPLRLDDNLERGAYRRLTIDELVALEEFQVDL